jgi:hypothetical protein
MKQYGKCTSFCCLLPLLTFSLLPGKWPTGWLFLSRLIWGNVKRKILLLFLASFFTWKKGAIPEERKKSLQYEKECFFTLEKMFMQNILAMHFYFPFMGCATF